MAGDFSPLTVDTSGGGARLAPPAMLVAIAVGLGSVDMPIPDVSTWEWVNWKFPKPVHAGETIYARWTLTQKRPPVHGSRTGIVVWRVDVHTADAAVCAEGEIGAAVLRRSGSVAAPADKGSEAPAAAGRRRRRRRSSTAADPQPAPQPAPPAQPKPAAEKPPRRRRRGKRGGGGASAGNGNGNGGGDHSTPAPASEPTPALPPAAAAPSTPVQPASPSGTLSRVMRRLRGT